MKFALIESGIVTQLDFTRTESGDGWVEAPDAVAPGYLFDGETWTAPTVPPVVPMAVSSRQFKLQLLADGLLDAVDTFVSGQDRATRIAYEYSGRFERSSPMMQAGFAALGKTNEEIDAFFMAASQL